MVLPWLIVGASAAFNLHRKQDSSSSSINATQRQLRAVQQSEKALKKEKANIQAQYETVQHKITTSESTQTQQQSQLEELREMKQQYEERLTELDELAEGLSKENEALRVDNKLWKERADAYLNQTIQLKGDVDTLQTENNSLKDKLQEVFAANAEEIAKLKAMIEDVKDTVQTSMDAFTSGDCSAQELQQRLLTAGVQITCKPEQLEAIRGNAEATQQLTDTVNQEFTAQLPFVLDDTDRIKNFMGIAHSLRSSAPTAALTSDPSATSSATASEAGVTRTPSLGVQSQSSTASSLPGLFQNMMLMGRPAAAKRSDQSSVLLTATASTSSASSKDAANTITSNAGAAPFPALDNAKSSQKGGAEKDAAKATSAKPRKKNEWAARKNVKTTIEKGRKQQSTKLSDLESAIDDNNGFSMSNSAALTWR